MERIDRSASGADITPKQSFTNLAKFSMRRSHAKDTTQSTDDTPPMTPSRGALSVPKTPISATAATAGGGSAKPPSSTTTSSNKGKKLLVDQFYNAVNEKKSTSSSPNVANPNALGGIGSANHNRNSSVPNFDPGADSASIGGVGGDGGAGGAHVNGASAARTPHKSAAHNGMGTATNGYSSSASNFYGANVSNSPSASNLSSLASPLHSKTHSHTNSGVGGAAAGGAAAAAAAASFNPKTTKRVPTSILLRNNASLPSDVIGNMSESLSDESFKDIIRQGGAKYISMDNNLLNDEDLATYLLNIDNVVTGEYYEFVHQQQQQGAANPEDIDPLKPVERILAELSGTLTENVSNQISAPFESTKNSISKNQILRLKNYIRGLHEETTKLQNDLKSNKELTKKKYQSELNSNVKKLKSLLGTLDQLEKRLNNSRSGISASKNAMAVDIKDKLQILEYVDKKMIEHERVSKERRMKMVSYSSATLVLLISIWWSYRMYGT